MYTAANLSDGIARDAARAAAATVPSINSIGRKRLDSSLDNFNRANAVVNVAKSKLGGCMRDVSIDNANSAFNIPAGGIPDAFLGGQWLGTVTVRVRTTYVLPVPLQGITPPIMTHEAEAQFPLTVSSPGTVKDGNTIK